MIAKSINFLNWKWFCVHTINFRLTAEQHAIKCDVILSLCFGDGTG